jgi:hypothetical protein
MRTRVLSKFRCVIVGPSNPGGKVSKSLMLETV